MTVPQARSSRAARGISFALALGCALAAQAETYKWKDQYGQVHYSQFPPKDAKAETITAPAMPGTSPNQESLNKAQQDAQKAEPEKKRAAEAAALEQERRQNNCRSAIERLAYLDAHAPNRIATKDDQGNVQRMTPEEHARQRAAEQDKMKANCD